MIGWYFYSYIAIYLLGLGFGRENRVTDAVLLFAFLWPVCILIILYRALKNKLKGGEK
jgi:hypothetical protein